MYSVHACCTAVSASLSVPKISVEKWSGFESRADAREMGRSKHLEKERELGIGRQSGRHPQMLSCTVCNKVYRYGSELCTF